MADSERQTDITDEVRLPDGTTVREYTNPETGNITYRRVGPGISGAKFISPDVAEGLKQTTELGGRIDVPEGELTQQELDDYGIGLTAEQLRERRIQNKYPQIGDTVGVTENVIPGGASNQKLRNIQGWYSNQEVKTMVRNDPLLETEREKRRAREAIARDIVDKLSKVNSRQEAKYQVLREYGIY